MTVRTGYVLRRSAASSAPRRTKRRERSSGQERRSERAAKSNVKIKASENSEIVFRSVRLYARNRALFSSERRLSFKYDISPFHTKAHQTAKAAGVARDQRTDMTMTKVVDYLSVEYGWSRSVPNLSGKLKRGSLRYGDEAVELADALGYDIVWQKRK
mgnify:FL=1